MLDDELPIDPDLESTEPGAGTGRPGVQAPSATHPSTDTLAAIALGGAVGTTLRAVLGQLVPTSTGHFPATTMVINIVGSLVLGTVMVIFTELTPNAHRLRLFVTTGILGGFTTFSTFTVDIAQLSRRGHVGTAAVYLTATIVGGVVAAFCGLRIGHQLVEARLTARGGPRRAGADDPTDRTSEPSS